jgi:DNA-binding transcriptional ArsR family regulator
MVQYQASLDAAFAALADPTRRGILERLGHSDASISEIAGDFAMTLTGLKKHVRILEDAQLVTSEKQGRVRTCRLGPRRLGEEAAWIATYRRMLEERLDHLGAFLERTSHAAEPSPRPNLRANPKANPGANPKANLRANPKANARANPKADASANPKANPRANPKAKSKANPRKEQP